LNGFVLDVSSIENQAQQSIIKNRTAELRCAASANRMLILR
jgi:hypothetical protein